MRNKEAEPLLLEEGRHGFPKADEKEEKNQEPRHGDVGVGDEGRGSKPAAGGGSSASAPASTDDSGGRVSTSGGEAAEGPHPDSRMEPAAALTPEGEAEDEEVAELVVSSSVHVECARQYPSCHIWLVLAETALDALQFVQTELEVGVWSVLVLRRGPLAFVSLLMAIKDCVDEVKEEVEYQYQRRWVKAERKNVSPGFLWSWVLIPLLVCLRLLPRESAPSGTLWWNAKLHHAVRVMAIRRLEVLLNFILLVIAGLVALYTVAKAAHRGLLDHLAIVTAVNAVQTILFILYKSYHQMNGIFELEEKLQKLRESRALGWEVREKLQELQRDWRVSLSDKALRLQKLVVNYPEHFMGGSHWSHESEYIDIYSVKSDPARTGAVGGVPAVEEVRKLLALKLDCTDKAQPITDVAAPAVDLEKCDQAAAILLLQGDAGAGKSTLARLVAVRATRASLECQQQRRECMGGSSASSSEMMASVAPFVVYLHCSQHQHEGGHVSVRRHLESLLVGDGSRISDKDWSGFVKKTPIVLVLDAYDEADSRFTLQEVLERDGLVNAGPLCIMATARSGTFENDGAASRMFACEINGRQVLPTLRWLRPIGDDERKSAALAPLKVSDGFWQKLHLKYPGLARVVTTPLMAALVAKAHEEGALEDLDQNSCGAGVEAAAAQGETNDEATLQLGSRIYKSRVRRRAHLISWYLKLQVEDGIDFVQHFVSIDLILHNSLDGVGRKEVWMEAGKTVARKLASLMWIHNTKVLQVTAPNMPGRKRRCPSLMAHLPSLSFCGSAASPDGTYSQVDSEIAVDVGQQLRNCVRLALPQARMKEVDVHVMLLYLMGFCCSLKILGVGDASTCEVSFTHDTFRACRLAEAMASGNDWGLDEASSRLWESRLLLANEHKDHITLLADITRSSVPFQDNFLWRCIDKSKMQAGLGDRTSHCHDQSHGSATSSVSVAAANAATVLTCAQVSFSGRDLSNTQLQGACLRGAVCHGTNFNGANLQNADLSHIFAEAASFRGTQLQKAWYGEYAMLRGHSEPVYCVASSPDGRTIASGSGDRTIRVWDAASGSRWLTLKGHSGPVTCVAYSPDGRTIASGSYDGTIRLWDAATGSLKKTLAGHLGAVVSFAYSPDGKTLAVVFDLSGTIFLWDAVSGVHEQTLQELNAFVRSVIYHPDGSVIASRCEKTILLWNVASGSVILTLESQSAVLCMAYSPDGRSVAAGCIDSTILLWDAEAGSLVLTIPGHTGAVLAIAYSADGSTIASGGGYDHTIRFVDATSGCNVLTLAGHTGPVMSVMYSPDGRSVASGSHDRTIRLWDPVSGSHMLQRDGHDDGIVATVFSPDGIAIASCSLDESLRLWDAQSGCHMLTLEGQSGAADWGFSYSPDGKTVHAACADECGCIQVWNAASGEGRRLTLEGLSDKVRHVCFSPDGSTLATWNRTSRLRADISPIRLWDTVTWSLMATLSASGTVWSIAFSPDGRTVAAASDSRVIPLWDVESGRNKRNLHGHSKGVQSVAFSFNGTACKLLASGSEDCTVKVWDVAGKVSLLFSLEGHSEIVNCVAFSPDGTEIVSCSDDRTIRLWDVASGVHRLTLEGHACSVDCVVFSPDGRTIVSSSLDDHSINVWRIVRSKRAWEAEEASSSPAMSSSTVANPESSEFLDRWLLQRSIVCAEPALWASGADFRGALGLGAKARLMLQEKGATVD